MNARLRPGAGLCGLGCVLLLLLGSAPASAGDADWLDFEGRIQYGFYTEDPRTIDGVLESLNHATSTEALQGYYVALAEYRLALLDAPRARDRARGAAERCADALDAPLRAGEAPELLALQSACLSLGATLRPLAPLASVRAGSTLRRALQLAPKNPRVLLIDALEDYDHAGSAAAAQKRVLAKLQKCVAAFEIERAGKDHAPGWGAAEAYAYLARSYLDTGDALAARGALEHALLIVPDFAFARRLLRRITAG